VSESTTEASPQDPPTATLEAEEIAALPVLAGKSHTVRPRSVIGGVPEQRRTAGIVIPAVQAAAVAAGGFVAGAAVVGLVNRRQRRAPAVGKGHRAGRSIGSGAGRGVAKAGELVQIVGSRSLLVDVHLLGGTGER
jgi:hypothetical protein